MKNILKFKRYIGSVVFNAEDKIFHWRLVINAYVKTVLERATSENQQT